MRFSTHHLEQARRTPIQKEKSLVAEQFPVPVGAHPQRLQVPKSKHIQNELRIQLFPGIWQVPRRGFINFHQLQELLQLDGQLGEVPIHVHVAIHCPTKVEVP